MHKLIAILALFALPIYAQTTLEAVKKTTGTSNLSGSLKAISGQTIGLNAGANFEYPAGANFTGSASEFRADIGAGTSSFDGAFSSLTGTPTTLVGYGITDAASDAELAAWTGSTNIATVGTITTGTWSGLFGAVSGANLTNLTAANIAAGTAGISITGNAATVTTNANLTGVVTSTGNATAIADAALSIAKTSGLQVALDAKGVGDMLKSDYDPQNLGFISGATSGPSVGGSVQVYAQTGTNSDGGVFQALGGTANNASGGVFQSNGGTVNGAYGGSFYGSGSDLPGGSVTTENGGGSITTTGTGSIQLGYAGTRTTLTGEATGNRTAKFPLNSASGHIPLVASTTGVVNLSGSEVTATLPIANGGTGQTSAQAAINALMAASGALSQGDVFYYNGTNVVRLPIGPDRYVITSTGAGNSPEWAPAGATMNPLMLSPAIWLDATSESYANNDPAVNFHDRSGHARDFVEVTDYPLFKTNILNGKPGIYFDGGDKLLKSYTGSGTDFTIIGVIKRDDDTFKTWWDNSLDPYFGIQTSGRASFYQGSSVQSVYSAYPSAVTEATIFSVISDSGTVTVRVGKNIVASGSATSSALKVAGLASLGGFQFNGYIHEVLATETALSDADYNAYASYLQSKWAVKDRRILMMDGDSITAGTGASDYAHSWAGLLSAAIGTDRWHPYNTAISGQTVSDRTAGGGPSEWMSKFASTQEYTLARRTEKTNIEIAWGGTNDLFYGASAASAYADYVSYCQAARAAGYKVIAVTMLDRQTGGGSWTRADMQTFNTSVRANWATFADALVDPITADARFDDNTSAVFADNVHPSDLGHSILAPLFIQAFLGLE